MSVPGFQSFLVPVLRVTADGNEYRLTDIRDRIAAILQLSPEDLSQKLPSGNQTVFANRLAWSSVYLAKAGALERTKRGVFKITQRGKDLLASNPHALTVRDLSRYPEFVAFHKGTPSTDADQETRIEKSPDEQLADAHKILQETLANDVLDAVRKASPSFFEELVIDLLVSMGYGGSMEDAGKAVGKSGDGGVDGIIKEDKLGLDVVYVQAKRWTNVVGRPVVQAFAGSLEGFRARKGVLITTSDFTSDALDYVQKIEKRIVLIAGKQLADLMIEHNIGVNVVQRYEVKRLDSDYFETI